MAKLLLFSTKPVSPRRTPRLSLTEDGFTLIEVVVALAILAAVAVVASQASSTYLRSVDNLKVRTLAHFVAQNTAANLQIAPQWLQSPQVSQVSSQGRTWQVTLTPLPLNEALGGNGNVALQDALLPVSIQIAPISSDSTSDGTSDSTNNNHSNNNGAVQHVITDLTVMVGKPSGK